MQRTGTTALIHFVSIFEPVFPHKFDCNTLTLMGRDSRVCHNSVARRNHIRPGRGIGAGQRIFRLAMAGVFSHYANNFPVIRASGGCFKA